MIRKAVLIVVLTIAVPALYIGAAIQHALLRGCH